MDPHIHITEHKKGLKMSGFISINTSQKINPFCRAQCKNEGSVCGHCYAGDMETTYTRLRLHLEKNYYRLSQPLTGIQLQEICRSIQESNRAYIRFNSLGELTGINNLMNYYRICEDLPDLHFGLWTKRPALIRKTNRAPENLSIIWSNPSLDHPVEKVPAGFHGVFNVLSYEYASDNGIIPNCAGQCIRCLKCYRQDPGIVNELLKKDQSNISKGFLKPLEEVI
jgi:hypothetical protein